MNVDWELTAQALFNQLSKAEQDQILMSLNEIEDEPECWTKRDDIQTLTDVSGSNRKLYVIKVGKGLRVILSRRRSTIVVVDVFPIGQIEGLRSAQRTK
jgi:hypothetical protein